MYEDIDLEKTVRANKGLFNVSEYEILIGINDKALLNIIENNYPKKTIYIDDSFFYGTVILNICAQDRNELLIHLYELKIYEEDIISIKKSEVKKNESR